MVRETIVQALEDRRVLLLDYAGGGSRTVQPHAILRKANGTEVLEAYQVRGHSEAGVEHGWKTFELSRIGRVELMPERFEPRRDFRPVSSQSGQLVAQVRRDEAVQL
jgi:predicted DNA-binding transcriptional regulator YafY